VKAEVTFILKLRGEEIYDEEMRNIWYREGRSDLIVILSEKYSILKRGCVREKCSDEVAIVVKKPYSKERKRKAWRKPEERTAFSHWRASEQLTALQPVQPVQRKPSYLMMKAEWQLKMTKACIVQPQWLCLWLKKRPHPISELSQSCRKPNAVEPLKEWH
jgi:hypothetical protein